MGMGKCFSGLARTSQAARGPRSYSESLAGLGTGILAPYFNHYITPAQMSLHRGKYSSGLLRSNDGQFVLPSVERIQNVHQL